MRSDARKPNHLLRHERTNRGWSQQKLAELLNTTEDMVSKWERGISNPSPFYQEKLCSIFDMSAEQLGFIEPANTKDSPLIIATQFTTLDQAVSERLDHIESILNLAWDAWFASRPKQAAKEITKLLPKLERMISTPYLSVYAKQATELAIRSHGLLGAICLDSLQNDYALLHYSQAHQYAEDLHDFNQASTYLALIGDVLRRQNKKNEAISHMEQAREQAINTSKATRGHILQLLAYTYADIGNGTTFEHTIKEATDLLGFTGEGRDTARKEFTPFEIYEIQGKANRDLGKPLKAISFLDAAEKSLEQAESVTPRFHALLDISRGQAYCDAGDLASGIELASRGFTLAYKCQSPRQMNRVRKLLRKLESTDSPWHGDRKIATLKELVYETYLQMDMDK